MRKFPICLFYAIINVASPNGGDVLGKGSTD